MLKQKRVRPLAFHPLCLLSVLTACVAMGCNGSAEPGKNSFNASPASVAPTLDPPADGVGQWLTWRGPNGNGIVNEQTPPTVWSDEQNVVWKSQVPGRGHASPIVVGNKVFLATADEIEKTQSVVAYDLASGETLWETEINRGSFNRRIHPNNTHASPTMCSDGQRLFAVFNNHQSAQLAALDLSGSVLWKKKAGTFIPRRYQFGFGASPVIYGDNVIVASECELDGSMAAFNRKTGEEAWRVTRNIGTNYSTPVVVDTNGQDQLVISGGNQVAAYEPSSGDSIWSVRGPWLVTCGTAVWDSDMIFASGGYPRSATLGIKIGGSAKIVWENRVKCYEQSMLAHDGYVYALSDNGVLYCWRAADGREMWKERLSSPVSASPVLANGNIYISIQNGKTYVFKANPERYEEVAVNKLGESAFATPTIVNNRILTRVGFRTGGYQEWLYCLGE